MFSSIGILRYFENPYKLIVEADQNISDYYRNLVPKYLKLNKQMHAAHISIVRKEIPINLQYWKKYEGEEIKFEYEGYIYNDETYYWLGVKCDYLKLIRAELGLPLTSWITESPDSGHEFHLTVGNTKKV